ncbi:hypothetical protein [Gilvimarinus agarilyticus]|uniref:hypothetical protein n=1 Tax=Gilvimarinus agarilyticus TaxID=679259 RepID=UPI0012FCCD2C|nr:hypothetical protein [Gilvimarinus agarilyticus]
MNNSTNSPASGNTLIYLAGLGSADSLEADNLSRHNRQNNQPQRQSESSSSLTQRLRVFWQKHRGEQPRA